MAEAIATITELQSRLDWELDSGEQGVATGALEDLSDDARYYGSSTWDSETAPRQVKSLVLRAAARFMRNPDGYTTSRAGDETLTWADQGESAGTAHFTSQERKMLAQVAGRSASTLHSVPLTAWRSKTRQSNTIYVQADSGPFPFYEAGEI